MKLQWKMIVLFVSLLIVLLMVQGTFIHFLRKPLFLSSLFGLMIVIPLAYLLSIFFTRPIQRMTEMAKELAKGSMKHEIDVDPEDELGKLSKAIGEIGAELRNKIEEISKEKDYLQTVLRGMMEGVPSSIKWDQIVLWRRWQLCLCNCVSPLSGGGEPGAGFLSECTHSLPAFLQRRWWWPSRQPMSKLTVPHPLLESR